MNEGRSRKRQRTDEPLTLQYSAPTCKQLILEEVDLEIGLRERLYETVQSRLTWALLLQESLLKGSQGTTDLSFQDAATDALDAIEESCNIIFDREIRPPAQPLFPLPQQPEIQPPLDALSSHQPPPRLASSRVRGLPRAPRPAPKKLLYLRNTATDPPAIAKLACSDCARSDFSSLQGLLNHCRLRHQREFGSHDECIQSCAVLVAGKERDWVIANGTELGGVSLPSLRRLFEIAVGAEESAPVLILRAEPDMSEVSTTMRSEKSPDVREAVTTSTSMNVSRTLGYHADTPALAPFLGRAPKKRIINVYEDPDETIDIVSNPLQSKSWRMPYNHRNVARAELDEIFQATELKEEGIQTVTPRPAAVSTPPSVVPTVASSRFHIVARVKIADHSVWIPVDRRIQTNPEHTHRWRLTVSSPSYSLHISIFLAKLTVICLTDPPPATLVDPITITEPPFVVMSTTDKPFLARLTFTWAGSSNAPMDIDHWVDVDPIHTGNPFLGDEQVFDVELDRNTELLPLREDIRKVSWRDEQSGTKDRDKAATMDKAPSSADADPDAYYPDILRSLLPSVSVGSKNAQSRASALTASNLIPTPAHARTLVYGRRKAIEMSRARALHEAYQRHIAYLPEKINQVALTVADIFRWMEEGNIFLRAPTANRKIKQEPHEDDVSQQETPSAPDAYCHNCGLSQALHPVVEITTENAAVSDVKNVLKDPEVCMTFSHSRAGGAILDVDRLLRQFSSGTGDENVPCGLSPLLFEQVAPSCSLHSVPASELVAIAHPQMVSAVELISSRRTVSPVVSSGDGNLGYPDTSRSRMEVEERLAPFALLAAAVQCVVKLLVGRGLDSYRRDEKAWRMLNRGSRSVRRRVDAQCTIERVLAPSHITRGLSNGGRLGLAESAALMMMARLGRSREIIGPEEIRREMGAWVKVEETESEPLGEL